MANNIRVTLHVSILTLDNRKKMVEPFYSSKCKYFFFFNFAILYPGKSLIIILKLWKLININLIQYGVRKLEERTLTEVSINTSYWPQEKDTYLAPPAWSDAALLSHQEEEKTTPCPVTAQPIGDCHTHPMRSHYTSNFQFTPMDSSFTTAPSKSIK